MGLRIRCGNCGQKYEFDRDITCSFEVACGKCQAVLTIPADAPATEPGAELIIEPAAPPKPKLSLRLHEQHDASAVAAAVEEEVPAVEAPPSSDTNEMCPRHPAMPAIGVCARCGVPVCEQCHSENGEYCSVACLRAAAAEEEDGERQAYLRQGEKLERVIALLKLSGKVALLLLVVLFGWLIWKWFFDPAGKVAWKWQHEIPMDHFLVLRQTPSELTFLCGDAVYRLNVDTGKAIAGTPNGDISTPFFGRAKVLSDGALIPGDRRLLAIDFNGQTRWKLDLAGRIVQVAVAERKALVLSGVSDKKKAPAKKTVTEDEEELAAAKQVLQMVDLNDGRVLWSQDVEADSYIMHLVLDPENLAMTMVKYSSKMSAETLFKVCDATNGKARWQVKMKKNVEWGPFLHKGLLLFRLDDTLHALQVADGRPAWSLSVPWSRAWGREEVPADVVYLTSGNELNAVDLVNGKILWSAKLPTFGTLPQLLDGKLLVLGTTEKKLSDKLDVKLPPAYEQLRKEDPAMNDLLKQKNVNTKIVQCLSCFDAATGKLLWRHDPVFGELVTGNGRTVLVWDSATTTALQLMGSTSGDTLVRQLKMNSGVPMYEKNDPIGMRPPYFICGRRLVGMMFDRDAPKVSIGFNRNLGASEGKYFGMAAVNLK